MRWKLKSLKDIKENLNKINVEMSSRIVCFTGNRPQKLPWGFNETDVRFIKTKKIVRQKIVRAIKSGYYIFLCGMALGFDMMCAEIILELKKKYKHIKLIGAIPCKNQSERWAKEQKDRYEEIIKKLDGIRCIYDKYISGCMQERNKFMVNNSSLVIAFFNGSSGGTKNTIDYALKQGVKVEIIKP